MLERQSIWLEEETVAALKRLGEQVERPVGWLIRKAAEEFVERKTKESSPTKKGTKG
jgi:predicted transcriptional regulator